MKREISSLGNRVRCMVMVADAEIHGNLVKTQYIRLKGTVLQRLQKIVISRNVSQVRLLASRLAFC